MKIACVHLEHFRAAEKADLAMDELTVLVGRNGAGKSTFLAALAAFYDVAAPFTVEDFYDRDVSTPIIIRLTYTNLQPGERAEFEPYLEDEQLIVTKKVEYQDARMVQRYFASSRQIPKFSELRAISNKTTQRATYNQLVDAATLPGLTSRATNAQQVEAAMAEYEAAHPESCEAFDREEQFFGPKNIGGGKLDKYSRFVYVPAVQEARDGVGAKRGTYLYQLLDMIVYRQIANREDVLALKMEFQEKVRKVYSADNLTEIVHLGEALNLTLGRFIPGAAIKLSWEDMTVPEIPNPSAVVFVGEDGFWGDISRKGHGLQRGIIITLLQHLAAASRTTAKPEPLSDDAGEAAKEVAVTSESTLAAGGGPDLILAIEEPELYQHPLRCRYLASLFAELTSPKEGPNVARNQILLTTHSPWFVDLERFESIRIVRKRQGCNPSTTEVKRYSFDDAAKEMARISGENPERFTAASFRARAIPVMTTQVSEGFFADKVVVVEGLTEVACLWAVAAKMGIDLVGQGLAVVSAGGKNNIDRPVVIFQGLGIPVYFVFDGDSKAKKKAETAQRNRRYLSLAGVPPEDFPVTQVGATWACFTDDIEGYFEQELTAKYKELRDAVAADLGYDEPSRTLKNYDAVFELVDRVYALGQAFPVLEEILFKALAM